MRGGRTGYGSSLASGEDEYEHSKYARGTELRPSRKGGIEDPQSTQDDEGVVPTEDQGYSIWSHVATVAGSLTVDLGKAWATNVSGHDGEDTPPGQESHLTRAMKAYHLEKARDPSDLPPWLFEEHERRPAGQLRYSDRLRDEVPAKETPRSRGLRDIYETSTKPDARSEHPPPSVRPIEDMPSRSKATNRLKELREAKRSAHVGPGRVQNTGQSEIRRGDDRDNAAQADGRPQRVGLPTAPSSSSARLRRS
jgi:hypothetical protein